MNAIRAEFRKVLTTKLALWLLAFSVAFTALNVMLMVYLVPTNARVADSAQLLQVPAYVNSIVASCANASIFVLIIGIIGMTGEYRHMTITATFLASPRRAPVILAKAVAYAVIGTFFGIVDFLVSFSLATITLAGKDHAAIVPSESLQTLGGVILGFAIYAILGVAVGSLIRNQVAALIIALVFVFLIQPLLSAFVDWTTAWLPGGALDAVMSFTYRQGEVTVGLFSAWAGGLLLIGYAIVLGAIASITTLKRDIT
jgi:ABC-2 type transport system permease protein